MVSLITSAGARLNRSLARYFGNYSTSWRSGAQALISLSALFATAPVKYAGAFSCWLARELGKLLGYDKWQNFLGVTHEAMEVCRVQEICRDGSP